MFRLLIVALHVRCVSKCAIKLLDPLGRSVELMVVESSASSELQGGTGRNSGVVPRSEHVHVENSELGHLSVKFWCFDMFLTFFDRCRTFCRSDGGLSKSVHTVLESLVVVDICADPGFQYLQHFAACCLLYKWSKDSAQTEWYSLTLGHYMTLSC